MYVYKSCFRRGDGVISCCIPRQLRFIYQFYRLLLPYTSMTPTIEKESEHPKGQLVVHAIEEKAQWMPNNTYMRYAPDDWEKNGYETITWKQYASAVDKLAFWFDEQLGKAESCETVAYFGPNDPRYAILVPAIIKNERKVSFEFIGAISWLTSSAVAGSRWPSYQRGTGGLDCSD
jgi:hypothetical protein